MNAKQKAALEVLTQFANMSAKLGDWRTATAVALGAAVLSLKTFDNWRAALKSDGFIEQLPTHEYKVTKSGMSAIGAPLDSQSVSPHVPATATPPKGVGLAA